ncbi:uncharacterized protein LOC113493733 [Trichoplusia ni]|uniref:Uncharacterized protein LOC113493733 n=1 Tax=Trichoplusia ni TaxID=7111 RepID=A0A7E5VGX2_TRINI|nr:uncharacterized protein LOC113493733 [Trichoplusia ni]
MNENTGPAEKADLPRPEIIQEKKPEPPTIVPPTNQPIPVIQRPAQKTVPVIGVGIKPIVRRRRNRDVATRDVGTSTLLIQTPHGVKRRILQDEPRFCLIPGNQAS